MRTLKETYDLIAEDWHRDHQQDDWWIEGTNALFTFLKQDAHILDAGCGSGIKSKILCEKGYTVTGFDISPKMIEIAKREVPEATFVVHDLKSADTIRGMYDGIFLQAALLHIPKKDAQRVVVLLADKLKPDGYFYIAVKGVRPGGAEEEVRTENDYGYAYQRFFSYFSSKEIKMYMENAGLEIVHEVINKSGHTDWIQIIGHKKIAP